MIRKYCSINYTGDKHKISSVSSHFEEFSKKMRHDFTDIGEVVVAGVSQASSTYTTNGDDISDIISPTQCIYAQARGCRIPHMT